MNRGPTYAPVRSLVLYLTEDCPLRCDYCWVVKKPRRMSSETALKAVDFLLERQISGFERTVDIVFFGGEPFLEAALIEEIVEYVKNLPHTLRKNVAFHATTSGTVLSPHVERLIRDTPINLLVSVDGGPEAARHRPYADGRSSYDMLKKNLPRLVAAAPECVVRMTFHPDALDLVGNIRHLLELGAPSIALCPVIEAPWSGRETALENAYMALADWYIDSVRGGRVPPLVITNDLLRLTHLAQRGPSRPARPCGVATRMLGIDPDGNVMPCHRFIYRSHDWLGHVDSPVLTDARWQYVHLRSEDIMGCDRCFARSVCGGGCPLVALAAGLPLNEPHPGFCLTKRAHVRAVQHIYETLARDHPTALDALLHGQTTLSDLTREVIGA